MTGVTANDSTEVKRAKSFLAVSERTLPFQAGCVLWCGENLMVEIGENKCHQWFCNVLHMATSWHLAPDTTGITDIMSKHFEPHEYYPLIQLT
jgi:hypothetical protein